MKSFDCETLYNRFDFFHSSHLAPGFDCSDLIIELCDGRQPDIGVLGGKGIAKGKDEGRRKRYITKQRVESGYDCLLIKLERGRYQSRIKMELALRPLSWLSMSELFC